MRTLNGMISSLTSNLANNSELVFENHLTQAVQSNQAVSKILGHTGNNANNAYFGLSAMEAKAHYKKLYSLGTIMQCNYAVYLNDIFNIANGTASWFHVNFPLSWLASEVDMSLGSLESESFFAGSHQFNYITQQSSDTLEVTFIETKNMDISKSYAICKNLTAPPDGIIKEPKRYTFELVIAVFGNRRNLHLPIFEQRHLVSVKEASVSLSSAGRNETAKVQVTFQKIRPHKLFSNSAPLVRVK